MEVVAAVCSHDRQSRAEAAGLIGIMIRRWVFVNAEIKLLLNRRLTVHKG